MNKQMSKRLSNIGAIKKIISRVKNINYKKLAMEISIKKNVSLRCAKEYIQVARYQLKK